MYYSDKLIFCLTILYNWEIVLSNKFLYQRRTTTSTLKFVIIVFCHGSSTPSFSYPNDPNAYYKWPSGYSSLTTKGSLQMYNLGKKLRERYIKLLPENGLFTKNFLHVKSSETNPTIMSAQSLLSGFLIPSKNVNSLPIDWQPIPIHAIPSESDAMILGSKHCKKYEECLSEITEEPPYDFVEVVDEVMPYNDFLYYIKKHTRMKITLTNLIKLYDTLGIQENHNLTMPYWYKPINVNKMKKVIEKIFELLTDNFIMKIIRGGPLLSEISNYMQYKINKNVSEMERKFVFYSGHDITLSALIRSLEIDCQTTRKPEYGSTLIFELYDNPSISTKHEVKLFFYENSECEKPIHVKIPYCSEPCSFDRYNDYILQMFYGKYDRYCNDEKNKN